MTNRNRNNRKMSNEMRWRLAQRRAERIYKQSPHAGLSCGPIKLHVADANIWNCAKGVFVLQFGAYGCTHVLAYGCLENALEDAAAWLRDNQPGCFVEPDYDYARENLIADGDPDPSEDDVSYAAEEDLTRTESGWLISHEVSCLELSSPAELLAYVANK